MQIETIANLQKEYFGKIDHLDLDLILANVLRKPREFVLAYPEHEFPEAQLTKIRSFIARRANHEPLAYILEQKEFYGLNFKVTKDTLIPRPETEMLVEKALEKIEAQQFNNSTILDVGTGSGNIIISLAKNTKNKKIIFFGTDISKEALAVARHNTKKNKVAEKIKFIESDLLNVFIQNIYPANKQIKYKLQNTNLIIIANLPYLSKENYSTTALNVKNFEPKSALLSGTDGLYHYKKLLSQIKFFTDHNSTLTAHCFFEFSPEQKKSLEILIKKIIPSAKIKFEKDLAQKWRICTIDLN